MPYNSGCPIGSNMCVAGNTGIALAEGSQSSFMEKNGGILGWIIISIWIIIIIACVVYIHKNKEIKDEEKKSYYIGPILLSILVLIDIIYYIIGTHNKSKNKNLIFINIALIPIYLIIGLLLIVIVLSAK